MTYEPLRPLSIGQILDGAFTIYRRHFVPLVGVVAVLYGPIALALAAVTAWMEVGIGEESEPLAAVAAGGLFLLIFFIALVAYTAAEGALMRAVSDLFLQGQASVSSACRAAIRKIFALLGGAVLKWLVIGGSFAGATVLVVVLVLAVNEAAGELASAGVAVIGALGAGILVAIVFAMLFAVAPVIMLEEAGPGRALSRSSQLARGRWTRILVVTGVATVIGIVLAFGAAFLTAAFVSDPIAMQLIQQVVTIVFAPYFSICIILLYYDSRIRSEGFDLQMLAEQLRLEEGAA